MGIISKARGEKAVYWQFTGNDGFGGRTFASAVEIDCRWDLRQEQFIDAEGEETVSLAVVQVDRAMEVGSYLWRGSLTGSEPADPTGYADAWPIRQYGETPKLNYAEVLYRAWL